VTPDDPSFPAAAHGCLIEGENGTCDLICSRSEPQAARRPPTAPRPAFLAFFISVRVVTIGKGAVA
jgi:hypothetical protein